MSEDRLLSALKESVSLKENEKLGLFTQFEIFI